MKIENNSATSLPTSCPWRSFRACLFCLLSLSLYSSLLEVRSAELTDRLSQHYEFPVFMLQPFNVSQPHPSVQNTLPPRTGPTLDRLVNRTFHCEIYIKDQANAAYNNSNSFEYHQAMQIVRNAVRSIVEDSTSRMLPQFKGPVDSLSTFSLMRWLSSRRFATCRPR